MISLLTYSNMNLWDVLSFPAIAEQDETYDILTPYGRKQIHRKTGEVLHPALVSLATLESQRRAMTEYNFTAQYQQNPQPPSGLIVKREWLTFYGRDDKPERFDQIIAELGYCKQGHRACQF